MGTEIGNGGQVDYKSKLIHLYIDCTIEIVKVP